MTAGLAEPVQTLWWLVIGIGVVVVLCLVILMSLLRGLITDIDTYAANVASEVHGLAENTATSGLLERAAAAIGQLGAELERHLAVLSKDRQS